MGEFLGVKLFLIILLEGSKLHYKAVKVIGVLKAKAKTN
jgi:hypothetical protein